MQILVTGASGHLGRKLFDHLEAQVGHKVTGLDIRPDDHPNIHVADFGSTPDWARHFEGVEVIVHLAGDRKPTATWASSIRNNMDATLALYHHAVQKGVRRVVVASSNWVQGNRRFGVGQLNQHTPPEPVNAYGMSKLFCEMTGGYFSEYHGLSVICLRIGWNQWTHGNRPGPHMAMGRWGQEMWLSDRDFLNCMEAAIMAENVNFAVLNLMSNNPGMRWDIQETKAIIGYQPEDGSRAVVPPSVRMKSWLKRMASRDLPRFSDRWMANW